MRAHPRGRPGAHAHDSRPQCARAAFMRPGEDPLAGGTACG